MISIILQIQQQAITEYGGISADWVLVGITAISFLLGLRILNRIEKNLEVVTTAVNEHNTKIELHDQSIDSIMDQLRQLKPSR